MKSIPFLLAVLSLSLGCQKAAESWKIDKTRQMEQKVADVVDDYLAAKIGWPPAPTGYTDATFVKAAAGNNSKKTEFMVFSGDQLDKKGNLVDPWGHPYHLIYNEKAWAAGKDEYTLPNGKVIKGKVFIWSDGPNGKNEGGYGDDIRNWQ